MTRTTANGLPQVGQFGLSASGIPLLYHGSEHRSCPMVAKVSVRTYIQVMVTVTSEEMLARKVRRAGEIARPMAPGECGHDMLAEGVRCAQHQYDAYDNCGRDQAANAAFSSLASS